MKYTSVVLFTLLVVALFVGLMTWLLVAPTSSDASPSVFGKNAPFDAGDGKK